MAILSLKDFLGHLRIPHLPENFSKNYYNFTTFTKIKLRRIFNWNSIFLVHVDPETLFQIYTDLPYWNFSWNTYQPSFSPLRFTVDTIANRFIHCQTDLLDMASPFLPSFEFFGFSKLDLFAFPSFHELQPFLFHL